MPIKLNKQVIQSKTFKNKSLNRSQVRITASSGQPLDLDDIHDIYENLIEMGISSDRIGIVGMNDERLTTIVSRDKDGMFDFADEEYLKNKPEAIQEKLSNFQYIDVLIYPKSK